MSVAAAARCSNAVVAQIPAGTKVATTLFASGSGSMAEPSGLVYVPSKDLLIVASDRGTIAVIDQTDPENWWDLAITDTSSPTMKNWEGLAVDLGDSVDHFYVVHEGQSGDCPRLKKLTYTLGTNSAGTATVASDVCLTDFDGLLTSDDGIESLTLYRPSNPPNQPDPIFLMGVQKTGIIYSVSGNGTLTGVELPATNRQRVSGSEYFPLVSMFS